MLKKIYDILNSITTAVILLFTISTLFAVASFLISDENSNLLNRLPLQAWLQQTNFGYSWWLWLSFFAITLLSVNTFICTADSIYEKNRRKFRISSFYPHLIHLGFLFIMLAHLQSAKNHYFEQIEVYAGQKFILPNSEELYLLSVDTLYSKNGFPIGNKASIAKSGVNNILLSPNHPYFSSNNFALYIKNVENYPYPRAIFEIRRETGSLTALLGAIFFILGSILIWIKKPSITT